MDKNRSEMNRETQTLLAKAERDRDSRFFRAALYIRGRGALSGTEIGARMITVKKSCQSPRTVLCRIGFNVVKSVGKRLTGMLLRAGFAQAANMRESPAV